MNPVMYILIAFALGGIISIGSIALHIFMEKQVAKEQADYTLKQGYSASEHQKEMSALQVKMNESFLPIKQEETRQLKIAQEREFQNQTFQEKMRGEE